MRLPRSSVNRWQHEPPPTLPKVSPFGPRACASSMNRSLQKGIAVCRAAQDPACRQNPGAARDVLEQHWLTQGLADRAVEAARRSITGRARWAQRGCRLATRWCSLLLANGGAHSC